MRIINSARSVLLPVLLVSVLAGSLSCRGDLKDDSGIDPSAAIVQLIVTPAAITVPRDQFVNLLAYGITLAGDSVAVAVDWTSAGGILFSYGSFLSSKDGVFEVIGRARNFPNAIDTAIVTVNSGPVTLIDLVINPVGPILAPGETRPFLVESHFSDSSIVAGGAVNWSATGGTITAGGNYTAGAGQGSFQVIATSQTLAIADTVAVTINNVAPSVQSVVLAPDTVTLRPGGGVHFSAFGNYSDGTFAPAAVTYTVTGGSITSAGAYVASQVPGSYRVIATHAPTNKADTSDVTVVGSSLVHIDLNPSTAALTTGTSQLFTVTGTYSDSSTAPVAVTFAATGGTITGGGIYSAGSVPGTYSVIATTPNGLFADSAAVNLNLASATLTSIQVTPATLSIVVGSTQQFSVVGLLSDGTRTTVDVNWTASGGNVTQLGLYTAPAQSGSYRVIATTTTGAFADTVVVTANPAVTLTKIDVTPATVTLLSGAIQQFSAIGRLSNGGNTAVTVTWSATGGTISATGQYNAGANTGTFRAIAAQQGGTLADTAVITIANLPPPGSPACANEPGGLTPLFDQPWNAVPPVSPALDAQGWNVRSIFEANNKLSIQQDPTAPRSQPNIMAGKFPAGSNGGAAPFRMNRPLGRSVTTIYGCLFTMLDPGFTNNGNVGTKFGYIMSPYFGSTNTIDAYLNLTNNLGINIAGSGLNRNMQSSFSLVGHRGVWVKVEYLMVSNTQGNADGIARMWVNGALVLSVTNAQYFLATQIPSWILITWNPTYGGGLNPVPYDMFQYIDNWYMSVQ